MKSATVLFSFTFRKLFASKHILRCLAQNPADGRGAAGAGATKPVESEDCLLQRVSSAIDEWSRIEDLRDLTAETAGLVLAPPLLCM